MSSNISSKMIRRASTSDEIKQICRFFNSDPIRGEIHLPVDRELLISALNRDDWQEYYLVDEEKIVAATLVSCNPQVGETVEGQIRLIATDPEYRRRGFGTELVKQAIKFALAQDMLLLKIKAPTREAVKFGKSCGFCTRHLGSCIDGREALIMTRDVKRLFGVMPPDPPSKTGKTTTDNIDEVRL